MTIEGQTTAPAAAEPPAPAPAAPPAPAVPPATEPAATDPAEDSIPESLRPYVAQLRDEAAKRRTEHAPYRDAFAEFSEPERQYWLGLTQKVAKDPVAAARDLVEIGRELLGDKGWQEFINAPSPDATLSQAPAPAGEPGTPDVQDLIRQELAEREKAQSIATFQAEARQLGFTPGTEEYLQFAWLAANVTKGDLLEAKKRFDAMTGVPAPAAPTAEAASASAEFPPTAKPAGVGAPSGPIPDPPTPANAKARARALLEASRRPG